MKAIHLEFGDQIGVVSLAYRTTVRGRSVVATSAPPAEELRKRAARHQQTPQHGIWLRRLSQTEVCGRDNP
jgi:hypothetical protein